MLPIKSFAELITQSVPLNCFMISQVKLCILSWFQLSFPLVFFFSCNDYSKRAGWLEKASVFLHINCGCCESKVVKPQETSRVFMTSLTFFPIFYWLLVVTAFNILLVKLPEKERGRKSCENEISQNGICKAEELCRMLVP